MIKYSASGKKRSGHAYWVLMYNGRRKYNTAAPQELTIVTYKFSIEMTVASEEGCLVRN